MQSLTIARRRPHGHRDWADGHELLAILDSLPVNTFVCDLDLRLTYLSPTAARTMRDLRDQVMAEFGVEVDNLVGLSIHRFHKDPVEVERILARPDMFPHRASFPLGTLRLQTTIDAIRDRSGRVSGFVAVVDNITDKYELSQHLVRAAVDLSESSMRLAGVADGLEGMTAEVADEAAAMATGTEELTASIDTVSRSVIEAAAATRAAVEAATEATGSVEKLDQSSTHIGEITNLINSIAGQTKLLALNATIEASRAGAAGNGFAVVADEVKQLAQRTHTATTRIAEAIEAIQADSARARTAIEAIVTGIQRVDAEQGEIAAAVEHETINAQQIAAMVEKVAASVEVVASATQTARDAAESLSAKSTDLDKIIPALVC